MAITLRGKYSKVRPFYARTVCLFPASGNYNKKPRKSEASETMNIIQLKNANVHSMQSFLTIFHFERNFIVLTDLIPEAGNMNKDVFTAIGRSYKTEAFSAVEKFYCTFLHCNKNKKMNLKH